jgi:2-polyprenyl-6-hydroxyphenyl methylase/3-demethylubiquinone-9 3-methyltransferase
MRKDIPVTYTCSVCGHAQGRRPVAILHGRFAIIRCGTCAVETVYPMPSEEELTRYYSHYQVVEKTHENERIGSELVDRHRPVVDYLVSKIGRTHDLAFFDYGFGKGAFLKHVAGRGISATGMEFSDDKCRELSLYCKKKGLTIRVVQAAESGFAPLPQKGFDCVTLFSVIEHVIDPPELIRSLSRLLKPKGFLYIECPNNDALYLKIKNIVRTRVGRTDFFNSLNPPQHLYGFNRRSLGTLLERAGLVPVEIADYPYADGLHQVETLYWYPTFGTVLGSHEYWNFYQVSKLLIRALDPLASRFFRAGGGLYALARKEG